MVERGRRDSDITVTFSPVDVESQDTQRMLPATTSVGARTP